MKSFGCLLAILGATFCLTQSPSRADDKKDKDADKTKVVFLVKTDFEFGKKDVEALKDGKVTDLMTVKNQPKEAAITVSEIKLEGTELPTGTYTAVEVKGKKDGKDQKAVFYFSKPPEGSVKLSNLTLKGEAKADYKTFNAGYKGATVYIFEATPEKGK
jgi:hypothetical protein